MTTITIETAINAPVELCFDLARDLGAHVESASFSDERLVEPGKTAGVLELGDMYTIEGTHFGFRQRFTTKIVELQSPHRFVDEMVKGTFKRLQHVHEFHAAGQGTLMRDVLSWKAPMGVLGKLSDVLFLKRHMRRFVTRKQFHLKRLAETKSVGSGSNFTNNAT
ncbi:MAG TPA: SRPBCC family protein [Terriglobia bacterium]|nr:SRPBCC family protein [Terriglobia bacterium]